MKNIIIILTLLVHFNLFAEEEAPSSTELIIPTVIIEFDGQSEQVMELLVPDYDDILLPDFEINLPDPGEIAIDEIEFDLPVPGFVGKTDPGESSFFSEGVLGLGAKNHLLGNVSLFHLSKGLSFSLSFAHDGLDGFGENDAGTGYSYRNDVFEGDFRKGDETLMISASGLFKEKEDGLQQEISSHTSLAHRLSSVELGISGNGNFSWNGDLGLTIAEKTLTGVVPKFYDELIFSIDGNMGWNKNWFSISLDGNYKYDRKKEFNTSRIDKSIIGSDLHLGFTFSTLDVTASSGVLWLPGNLIEYPFSISLLGAFKNAFQYQTSGGFFVHNYSNFEIWNNYSFLEIADGIDKGWFWDGKIEYSSISNVNFGLQWLYRNMGNYMSVDMDSYDFETGLFSVSSNNGQYLDLSPSIKFIFFSELSVVFGWDGQLLEDIDALHPVHSVYTDIEYTLDNYGFFFSSEYNLNPFDPVPPISLGINYSISEGVNISLEGTDLLGFFSDDRTLWGNYIEVGGTITLITRISL